MLHPEDINMVRIIRFLAVQAGMIRYFKNQLPIRNSFSTCLDFIRRIGEPVILFYFSPVPKIPGTQKYKTYEIFITILPVSKNHILSMHKAQSTYINTAVLYDII